MKKFSVIAVLALSINGLSQIPTDGLIGYWPFSGCANDLSDNSYHGEVNGATLTNDRFGNPNSAYHFDGINDYITLNNDMPVIHSLDFSVSIWAKMDGVGGGLNHEATIFEQRHDLVTETSSTIALIPEDRNGNAWIIARTNMADRGEILANSQGYGNWHHYVATLGSDDTLRLYIDGTEVGEVFYPRTGNYTTFIDHVDIGSHRHTGNDIRGLFYGDIDDVRIYNRGLSKGEVDILFNEGLCYKYISVTDTLIINVKITGYNPIEYQNTIKIFPNPTKDNITIDFGVDFMSLSNYTMRIINLSGQPVFEGVVNQQQIVMDLSTWTGNGIYFMHLIDLNNNTISVTKIILQ
jgi:hypothetical protein